MLISLKKCKIHNIIPEFRCWEQDDVLHGWYLCPKCCDKDKSIKYFKSWKEFYKSWKEKTEKKA